MFAVALELNSQCNLQPRGYKLVYYRLYVILFFSFFGLADLPHLSTALHFPPFKVFLILFSKVAMFQIHCHTEELYYNYAHS